MHFGNNFNQPINIGNLHSLNSLHFGDNFNQKITILVLPCFLTYLHFGSSFNNDGHVLDKDVLPKTLTCLHFGSSFNQQLTIDDLQSLTYLHFGSSFNQQLKKGDLPQSLTKLYLCSSYKKLIDNKKLESVILPNMCQLIYYKI